MKMKMMLMLMMKGKKKKEKSDPVLQYSFLPIDADICSKFINYPTNIFCAELHTTLSRLNFECYKVYQRQPIPPPLPSFLLFQLTFFITNIFITFSSF